MAQTTAGLQLGYGAGTVSGKPTAYTHIPHIVSFPEIGGAPDTIDVTSTDNLEYKSYIAALKDLGGALAFTANDEPEFRTAWEAAVTATSGQYGVYAAITIPAPLSKRLVFKAQFTPLGFGGGDAGSALQAKAYLTPLTEPEWEAVV